MDGCLAFWERGCVIDWQAWGAVATFIAAFVALRVAGRERRDRIAAEHAEAKVMAQVLSQGIRADRDRLHRLSLNFDLKETTGNGWVGVLLTAPSKSLNDLGMEISRIQLKDIQRLESRLHILPPSTARAVMAAYLSWQSLLRSVVYLAQLSASDDSSHRLDWCLLARDEFHETLALLDRAREMCIRTSLSRARDSQTRWTELKARAKYWRARRLARRSGTRAVAISGSWDKTNFLLTGKVPAGKVPEAQSATNDQKG